MNNREVEGKRNGGGREGVRMGGGGVVEGNVCGRRGRGQTREAGWVEGRKGRGVRR